jgi:hypothetical protein
MAKLMIGFISLADHLWDPGKADHAKKESSHVLGHFH